MAEQIDQILAERQTTHGDYNEGAFATQTMKEFLRGQSGWAELNPGQAEALDMICHKISRIITGNPDIHDHWDDIAGYAKLASKSFEEQR